MLRVGLTGGIGSGKSTVAARFGEHGALVVDADVLAREVVAPGSDGLAEVAKRFGDAVIMVDGSLDRPALAELVFGDQQARKDLEQITHPRIAARTHELIAAAPPEQVVVHDVPLLVEKHMGAAYHLVVIVDAPEPVRVGRLESSRGMTPAAARARIASQATVAERRAAADVWLDNSGDRAQVIGAVDALWRDRVAGFNDNVLAGARTSCPASVTLLPYDQTWPAQAARLIARLRLALGERSVDVQHIGSTSVPGLLAQDVIDIQVGVQSLAEADAPGMVQALAAIGFPQSPEHVFDDSLPWLDDEDLWHKRFHGSADPGRAAHVHVRQVDEPSWRYAQLFRDWLSAHPKERDAFAGVKTKVARSTDTRPAYTHAKSPWIVAALTRADTWADRTGWTGR